VSRTFDKYCQLVVVNNFNRIIENYQHTKNASVNYWTFSRIQLSQLAKRRLQVRDSQVFIYGIFCNMIAENTHCQSRRQPSETAA